MGPPAALLACKCHIMMRQALTTLNSQPARRAAASAIGLGFSDTASSMSSSTSDGPQEGDSLIEASLRILNEPSAARKGLLTHRTAELWRAGKLPVLPPDSGAPLPAAPDCPARDNTVWQSACLDVPVFHAAWAAGQLTAHTLACMQVQMIDPRKMRRLGKGGTLESRQAIVHSLCNIESWAVDLSW